VNRVRPILLVRTVAQRELVAAACERSLAAGVRPGMTLAHARALLPAGVGTGSVPALVEEFDPRRDAAALRRLAAWATAFSPLVAPDGPDGLWIDITGCERYFNGERRLASRLWREVRRLGFAARVAIAPTRACAWAVARFGAYERAVVPPGQAKAAVADLPVRALGIDGATEAALLEVGIERIGQLYPLPRDQVPARFGADLLRRLDLATGEGEALFGGERIDPVRPAAPVRTEVVFDGPTTRLEAVHGAAREVLAGLCARLESLESGARLVELTLARVDAGPVVLPVTLSRPSRSARHLWSLFSPLLEKANLGFGVEGVSARAARLVGLPHGQPEWWHGSPTRDHEHGWHGSSTREHGQAAGELIDALVSRLGRDAVGRFTPVQTHAPERAFAWEREVSGEESSNQKRASRRFTAAGIEAADPGPPPATRPTILFDRPEPARVIALVPDGPPSVVGWRGLERRIIAALGPERLGEEWWRRGESGPAAEGPGGGAEEADRALRNTVSRGHSATSSLPHRDYFAAQDQTGLWLWLGRESASARWFVHGVWG
jgi:protein ImuB